MPPYRDRFLSASLQGQALECLPIGTGSWVPPYRDRLLSASLCSSVSCLSSNPSTWQHLHDTQQSKNLFLHKCWILVLLKWYYLYPCLDFSFTFLTVLSPKRTLEHPGIPCLHLWLAMYLKMHLYNVPVFTVASAWMSFHHSERGCRTFRQLTDLYRKLLFWSLATMKA